MQGDRIPVRILSAKILPNADAALLEKLNVPENHRSLGFFTADCDDVAYAALDEATKKAQVRVVYAQSMYAGSGNASTALAGEFIGVLSGETPEDVRSGLDSAIQFSQQASFYSANETDSVVYFAHCISRTGSYLSEQAGVPEGTAMAYLIAPPLEAMIAMDAALKAAEVELRLFYGPPTATNFAGGLLTGDQAACRAACEAFAEKVCAVAADPLSY